MKSTATTFAFLGAIVLVMAMLIQLSSALDNNEAKPMHPNAIYPNEQFSASQIHEEWQRLSTKYAQEASSLLPDQSAHAFLNEQWQRLCRKSFAKAFPS